MEDVICSLYRKLNLFEHPGPIEIIEGRNQKNVPEIRFPDNCISYMEEKSNEE